MPRYRVRMFVRVSEYRTVETVVQAQTSSRASMIAEQAFYNGQLGAGRFEYADGADLLQEFTEVTNVEETTTTS